jgi:DNA-directed RNA polymerase subunit RPC12/RpoP
MDWVFRNKNSTNDAVPAGSYSENGKKQMRQNVDCPVCVSHDFVVSLHHHHRLYKTCQWDNKVLRRLIGDGKLASRKTTSSIGAGLPAGGGAPSSTTASVSASSWECPICFCNYDEINRTTCCEKEICTECYLQLKPPQKNANVSCPYCVGQRLKVERCLESAPKEVVVVAPKPASTSTSEEEGKDSLHYTSMMTAPSSPSPNTTPGPAAYCLTPEQRMKLEAKVAEQQIHPLAARLAQEEAERRLANELHYLTSNPNLLLVNQQYHQQQQHYHHHHPSTSSSSSSASVSHPRPQLLHHPQHQQREQAHLLFPTTRTMLLTEEQQLAMAIEASLRTGS